MSKPLDPGAILKVPDKFLAVWKKAVIKSSPGCRDFKQALEKNRPSLMRIWQSYTRQVGGIGRLPLTDASFVAPYLIGFHLSNWARVYGTIVRAQARGLNLPKGNGPIRLIDLGCGSGAASQGLLAALSTAEWEAKFELELVDRSRYLIDAAKSFVAELWPTTQVRSLNKSLEHEATHKLHRIWQGRPARLNVLLMSYVWNELSSNPRTQSRILSQLDGWARCKTPTWLVINEPAAEVGARRAIALRDHLVDEGWGIAYPCPSSNFCPMTSSGRDWCYSEFSMTKSAEQLAAEKLLGVSREVMGSASYVFLNPSARIEPDRQKSVVVGFPRDGGKQLVLTCDGDKLLKERSNQSPLRGSLI